MKPYHLFLIIITVCSCISQKKNEAYIKEIDRQSQLLDAGTGLKKETIKSGITSGETDRVLSTVSVIFNPERPEYIKIEKKTGIDSIYNNEFYYRNQKLVKAKLNIKTHKDSLDSDADYWVVYYLHRKKCIKKMNEDPERSDCHTIKDDAEMALLEGLPLLPGNLK